jgi:hypothetical protein
MSVWRKKADDDYEATATSLNAAVFTNGPQMDGPAGSFSKGTMAASTLAAMTVGGLIGACVAKFAIGGTFFGGPWGAAVGALVGRHPAAPFHSTARRAVRLSPRRG